jgi:hypothetical protein
MTVFADSFEVLERNGRKDGTRKLDCLRDRQAFKPVELRKSIAPRINYSPQRTSWDMGKPLYG